MVSWGDCGPARTATKEYEQNIKEIFGEKEKKTRREVKVLSDEQRKRQAMFPY